MTQYEEEYQGAEAKRIAESFQVLRVDNERWEIHYRDPLTGDLWIMDYPDSELQGGGTPRLRRVTKDG